MTATFRFLQFLSLGCWVGSIIFFIVFTAGIFSAMPTKDLAGTVVGYSLARLHILGIVAGVVYLLATAAAEKSVAALVRPAALLVFVMIVCTMISQYGVIARMDALRLQMGSVDAAGADNPAANFLRSPAPGLRAPGNGRAPLRARRLVPDRTTKIFLSAPLPKQFAVVSGRARP